MDFQPLNSFVLVLRDAAETKTKGGIILPDQAQEKPKFGTVVAVGPGKIDPKTGEPEAMQVVNGQRILFKSYAGTDVKLANKEYIVIDQTEILGIVR